ncbi:MAG: hypothetical protein NXI24_05935 [bacterium]|nr:hypothetical protein [bacterium]
MLRSEAGLGSDAALRLLFSLIAFGFYFAVLAQGEFVPDRDAYFHIQIAREILAHGYVGSIPQMAHAIHAERYVDFHFLFHYALAPFAAIFSDPLLAVRVATAVFAALAVCVLDLTLAGMRVRYRWFWLLCFVLISPIFTGRLLFGRGITLFLSILFYFVLSLARRRFRRAGIVAGLAVWTYPGFLVLGGLSTLYFAAGCLQRGRPAWPVLLWPSAGIMTAFVIHPALPHQFYGYWLEFVVHSLRPGELEAIAEWLSPSKELLLLGLGAPAVVLLSTLLAARRHDALGAALLSATIFFLFASALSLKPFEYTVPFLILYAARQSRGAFRMQERVRRRALIEAVYVAGAAALLAWSMPQISNRMALQYRLENPAAHFAAADWLAENTPADTLVALPWDQFPAFYFRNPANRYLVGLNPVYSYGADRERYLIGRRFFATGSGPYAGPAKSGAAPLSAADDLRGLGAGFAVLDRRLHGRTLVALLEGDRRAADVVYHNARFVIVQARE